MNSVFFCFKNVKHIFDIDNFKKNIYGIVAFIAENKLAAGESKNAL